MKRALLLVLFLAGAAQALDVPYLSGRVNDGARLLDDVAAKKLENTLKDFEAKNGHQVVVLTLPSLEGEALEDFAVKVAKTWQLGRKGKDDGVLLLIAKDDRKMRIEVGYGLEGTLPDALCGRIIRGEITPRFRAGDFPGGVTAGVNAILGTIAGTYAPPADIPMPSRTGRNDFAAMGLLEKIMVSCFVFGILGVFESIAVVTPGVGWFLYFFLIPFWASFPMAIWGARIGAGILGAHLFGFPILKKIIASTEWGRKIQNNIHVSSSSGGSSGWSSGSSGGGWSSGGGSSFSGGGGSFGGGGSSGGW